MIKSEKPSKVWKNLNNYPELTKIESLVDETTSKILKHSKNVDKTKKSNFNKRKTSKKNKMKMI